MLRICDYIVDFLYKSGIEDIFMVTGGGAIFLNDGIAGYPSMRAWCHHHEQAAAMAAVAYAKYTNKLGAVQVTTGCGSTNALTGLLHAWQDSVPCIFVSGQVKRSQALRNSGLPLRQLGVQEVDILGMVSCMTKYAVMVNSPREIAYHMEKALYMAKHGRPGPVWIDVPFDVQGAPIDENALVHFNPDELSLGYKVVADDAEVDAVLESLKKAKRPVIVAGNGVRLSGAIDILTSFAERHAVPVVSSLLGVGLLPTDHPAYIGRIGNKGDRAGNFALQNSDMVLVVGCRLAISATGHEFDLFARGATVTVIDADPIEHQKQTVRIDRFVNADAADFLVKITAKAETLETDGQWLKKCLEWKRKWPTCLPEYAQEKNGVNAYYFNDLLSRKMPDDSVIVSDAGAAVCTLGQSVNLRRGQRYIASGAQAEMGFALPGAIGVSVARGKKEVLVVTGDGALQMNIQELQTIKHHELPIKMFIWNNFGYLSIRNTQRAFFGRFIGSDPTNGVSFPEIRKIADAYGIHYCLASTSSELGSVIDDVLRHQGPVLCEISALRDQAVVPTVTSVRNPDGSMTSMPLEDMYPFLPRDVFAREMIVPPVE